MRQNTVMENDLDRMKKPRTKCKILNTPRSNNSFSFSVSQLHSNPWICDCRLKNFRDWVVYRGLYTYPTSCAEPERLADKVFYEQDGRLTMPPADTLWSAVATF